MKKIERLLEKIISAGKTVYIGLGNINRCDDGLGIIITNQLKKQLQNRVYNEYDNLEEIILNLIEDQHTKNIIFIDAIDAEKAPGFLDIYTPNELNSFYLFSHKVPLKIYCDLLKKHQKNVFILGVQPKVLDFKVGLSDEIKKLANTIVKLIVILEKQSI